MHINPLSLSHTVVLYFTFIHVYFSPSAPHTLPCCPHTHTIIHTLLFIPSHTNTAVLCLPLLFCLTYAVPLTHTHTIILFYKQHQCFSYTPVYYNRGWNSIWEESVIACVCGRVLRFKRGLWQYVSRKVWFTACATFWNAHTRLFIQVCSRSHISPHKHAVWWANTLIEHTHTRRSSHTLTRHVLYRYVFSRRVRSSPRSCSVRSAVHIKLYELHREQFTSVMNELFSWFPLACINVGWVSCHYYITTMWMWCWRRLSLLTLELLFLFAICKE